MEPFADTEWRCVRIISTGFCSNSEGWEFGLVIHVCTCRLSKHCTAFWHRGQITLMVLLNSFIPETEWLLAYCLWNIAPGNFQFLLEPCIAIHGREGQWAHMSGTAVTIGVSIPFNSSSFLHCLIYWCTCSQIIRGYSSTLQSDL